MIDIIGLREDKRPQSSTIVHALLDRLEAAEKERDDLKAKIAEMERQEPVEWQSRTRPVWNDRMWTQWSKCSEGCAKDIMNASLVNDWIYEARPLYALPGAHPAQLGYVPASSVHSVIHWLRNGCDPMEAADELEMLTAAPEAKP